MLDFLIEIIFEVICEGFVSLVEEFLPRRFRSKGVGAAVTILFLILACALFVGLVIGVIQLVESGGTSSSGWLLVSLALGYILCGVLLKLFRRRGNK